MKRSDVNYLLVGIFVLAMGASVIAVLFKITGRDKDTESYVIVFDNVTNIQEGTTVAYGGFPIGYVDAIRPRREAGRTHYAVTVALRRGWQIPVDSRARIYTPGLLSDTLVEISEGNATTLLKPGERIAAEETVDFMAAFSEAALEIKRLSTDSIRPLIATLEDTITRLGSSMDTNMQAITQNSLALLESLEKNSQALATLLSESNAEHLSSVLENADQLTKELSNTAQELQRTGKEVNAFLRESGELVADNKQDIRATIIDMRSSMGVIAQNMQSIIYQLDTTSRNMNEFSRRLAENPGSLLGAKPMQDKAE